MLSLAACAQSDYHTTKDPNRELYLDSAFAHGHRHGYEEGFHAGDEAYQLRRAPSFDEKFVRSRGYQAAFGSKRSYMLGFDSGFRAGYADSYSGHPFRISTFAAPQKAPHEFDMGVLEGYQAGLTNSANIADQPGIEESAAWHCRQDSRPGSFCDGFGLGYVMGKSDSKSLALLPKPDTDTRLAKNMTR